MGEYTNKDKLTIRTGVDEAKPALVSEKPKQDQLVTEITIDYDKITNFASAAAGVYVDRWTKIPLGLELISKDLYVDTAFASAGNAEIVINLVDADDETSNAQLVLDADAASVADLAAGVNPNSGGAFTGTVALGTVTAGDAPKVVKITQDVAFLTNGKGVLRLGWRVPNKASDTLGS